ncbi:hypothetical protein [Bacillus nitroreducens]
MPLADIKREEDYYNSTYRFMHHVVEHLIYKHDMQALMFLIQKTNETGDFSKVFYDLTGIELKDYHNQFSGRLGTY